MNGGSVRWLNSRLAPRSWGVILVSGLVLIIMTGFVVYPMRRESQRLDRELARLHRAVAEQELMLPAYARLLASNTESPPQVLQFPARMKMGPEEVERLPAAFGAIAADSGLKLVSATPVFGGGWTAGSLVATVAARGEFRMFRGFILRAMALPACDSLGKLEIRSTPEGEELSMELRLNVKQRQERN